MKKNITLSALTIILGTTLVFGFDFGSALDMMKKVDTSKLKDITTSTLSSKKSSTSLDSLTVSSGLKQALKKGVSYGIKTLGSKDGYLKHFKIPLPKNLQKGEKIIRKLGGGKMADDLINSMNKAATQAAPKTAKIFLSAIDKLTIKDSKKILMGSNNEATKYFEKHTTKSLASMIKPIVKQSMKDNKVATYYDKANGFYNSKAKGYLQNNKITSLAKKFGVNKYIPQSSDTKLDDYVTKKAIAGLFKMIATKEKDIRKNPIAQTTSLLKKVFGK
jgi:hypothetical protein